MSKIPCAKCRFYSGSHYLICAIVPGGPNSQECDHFEEIPDVEPEKELSNHRLIFSGFCPQCGYILQRDYQSIVHPDCPECGWKNNSLQ